jgi:type II restriction enzyme
MKQKIRPENGFEYLHKNFIPTIASFNYLVDWDTVVNNKKKFELLLNNLNFLLGKKESFKDDFEYLLRQNPGIVEALPILLATRDKEINFIDNYKDLNTHRFVFKKPNLVNIDIINHYYSFVEKTGLKSLFCDYDIKNLVDYVFGIEVGLNSNARKNRTGSSMEKIVEIFLSEFCKDYPNFEFIEQATQNRIYDAFSYKIEIDKNSRRFDFALYNKENKKLFVFEVNFYSGGGSKLKATAGEYKELDTWMKQQNIDLIWVTDGAGWKTALRPLEETFNHNDYVINLDMLKNGILKEICHK